MIGWMRRMFTSKFTRLKREEIDLKNMIAVERHAERKAQNELRRSLAEGEGYQPSVLAQSFGWKDNEPDF